MKSTFEPVIIQFFKVIESGWEIEQTDKNLLYLHKDSEQFIVLNFTFEEAQENPIIEIVETDKENVYQAYIVS